MPANAPDRTPSAAKTVYRFGEFEARSETGELLRNGSKVRVQEQSLQVLLALLENAGTVVSRDQLCERLWPEGTYVDFENSLNAAVKRLRAALEDNADNPCYIETLPKRGYRLMVDVFAEVVAAAPVPEPQIEPSSNLPRRRAKFWSLIAVAALVIVAAAMFIVRSHRRAVVLSGTNILVDGPPQRSAAYELYLRSLGYKVEFPANAQAIELLEQSAALDPSSGRTWYELSKRYHVEFINTGRGQAFFDEAREANRRSLELAPDFSPAKAQRVVLDVESGRLGPAYNAALAMARANPQDFYAHFALAIALRHGGMFQESADECEIAFKLDPSNTMLRSCSLTNILLGRYERAAVFADLDSLSMYSRFRRMEIAILKKDKPAALELARSVRVGPHDYPDARLLEAALSNAPPETMRKWSRETEALFDRISLPEAHFVESRYLAWAGQPDPALRLLRRAIANKYCSYPVIDSDPLLANVRRLPEYKELRQAGIACRENFRTQMQAAGGK